MASMYHTGRAWDWLRPLCWPGEAALDEEVQREAQQTPPGARGVLFLPLLAPMGERSPVWNSQACGVFYGLWHDTTRGELVRAVRGRIRTAPPWARRWGASSRRPAPCGAGEEAAVDEETETETQTVEQRCDDPQTEEENQCEHGS